MTDVQRSLVILGAAGDLTRRLLLPGVGQLVASDRGEVLEVIGADQEDWTDEVWRERVRAAFAAGGASGERVDEVVRRARWVRADATSSADMAKTLAACHGVPALYFALPPRVAAASCAALRSVPLPAGTVLALEKPFGADYEGARELNRLLQTLLPEQQVQRVDHFLGKSTVLNLLGLRFANRIFERSWNADDVERVEITYDEALGLEDRAGYYDKAGALVDMIQSHLLQVLGLVAMEPPSSLDAEDLRGNMAQALRACRLRPGTLGRRARYTAGTIDGRPLPSYADEHGVDPARGTEMLAELELVVDNWRWASVPFVLRSGKAVGRARKDVVVQFKHVPHLPTGLTGHPRASRLVISLEPDRLELDVVLNGKHDPFELEDISFAADFHPPDLSAYGEVLHGILTGDPLLSVSGDVAEECWRIVTPALDAWRRDEVPLEEYAAGSSGPPSWGR